MPDANRKFYLTTPIYYVNARPHIGHAYSTIAADVIARRHRLLGDDVFFLTGTDEHGQKVQRSAAAAGMLPQEFADQVSASFENLWKRMGILDDSLSKGDSLLHRDFIRTTDPRHKRGVQKLWRDLEARGAIYLSTYTGQYSVGEEMFIDGPPGTLGPDGKPTETVTEENYFFRLSDYQEQLINLIESDNPEDPLRIQPESIRNEVLSFLRGDFVRILAASIETQRTANPQDLLSELDLITGGVAVERGELKRSSADNLFVPGALKDLSISRTTFDWGIKVPGNPKHVVYVWLDALANYLTAIGYGSDAPADIAKFENYWPADLHLVGKEITRFHCVYWPAFLLAAGLPLPKSVVANGWLLFEESKMSKSRGNVVRTETILEAFGPLCPPPPTPLSSPPTLSSRSAAEGSASPAPPQKNEAVILSAAKDPETANAATSDRPFQPPSSPEPPPPSTVLLKGTASAVPQTAPPEAAALAAEVTPAQPTKAQQDLFAADILRYYLLREIPFGQDGSFSFDALITRYNADLANGYGNLVSRTLSMIEKYFGGLVPDPGQAQAIDFSRFPEWWVQDPFATSATFPPALTASELETTHLIIALRDKSKEVGLALDNRGKVYRGRHFYSFGDLTAQEVFQVTSYPLIRSAEAEQTLPDFQRFLSLIATHISLTDEFLSGVKPWKMSVADDLLKTVLFTAWEMIRIITALLYPILPYATASVWAQLGLGSIEEAAKNGELKNLQWGGLKSGRKLGPLSPIFPRADKGLAQIMTELESPITPAPEPAAPPSPESVRSVVALGSPTENVERTTDNAPISIDDFAKIDLRVAQIVVAERIPKADKLLRLEVDLGPDHPRRQILSGIAEWYTPEELIGRRVAIIANLAPRKMRGLESHGMLLAASDDAHTSKPVLASFSDEVPLGSRIR